MRSITGDLLGSDQLPSFWKLNREERNGVATLYAALLIPTNLAAFAKAIGWSGLGDPERAEVYVEWTYLRDLWNHHGSKGSRSAQRDAMNADRRRVILEFLDPPNRSELERYTTLQFNEHFGAVPRPSATEIQYPGNWSVSRFHPHIPDKDAFCATCRFKWAFNIKPDLVVHGENRQLLCIEAKWDSPEGAYPSKSSELAIFAERGLKPLQQTEVQRYLVETLLGFDGSFCYVVKSHAKAPPGITRITWSEALAPLDLAGFAPFVEQWRDHQLGMQL